jgi:chaperonin GroES
VKRVPMAVEARGEVIDSKYGGTQVKVQGEEYLMLPARDMLAIIRNGREGS